MDDTPLIDNQPELKNFDKEFLSLLNKEIRTPEGAKQVISLSFKLLLFGLPIIFIQSTLWSLIYLLIFITYFSLLNLLSSIKGIYQGHINGAIQTLKHPPPTGKVHVQYTHKDKILFKSEEFIFKPIKGSDQVSSKHEVNPRSQAAYSWPDEKDRFGIVEKYRKNQSNIANKHRWALRKYQISGRTLHNYEEEYDKKDKDYIDQVMGRIDKEK
mgnify:CR=1 FL=1